MAELKLADRAHPLYEEYIDEWNFFLQSVKGGKEYLDGDNLFSHRLESQSDDFQDRKDRSYYLNFCDAVCTTYSNYIMKESVERPEDDILKLTRKNTNRRGDDIHTFMNRVAYQSSFFGHTAIIVDMPDDEAINSMSKLQTKDNEVFPYCATVKPTQLKDWSIDSHGSFNWILIERTEYDDSDPTKDRQEYQIYKLITRDGWEVQNEEGETLRSGKNTLGEVPIVICYHKDVDKDMIGESLIKDIAYINRIIFNWCSCMDEMIERQTFSQLVIPDNGMLGADEEGDDVLKRIGTSSIWTFPADAAQPPRFISPDTANLQIIWELILSHVREIHRLGGLTGVSEDLYVAQRSGKSQQYGFLNIGTSLAAKARNLERAENEINRFVYMWLGKDPEKMRRVVYPTKFDIEGLAQSLADTFSIVEREFSKRLNKELLKKLSLKSLPTATEDIKSEIEKEIEAGDGTIKELNSFGGGSEQEGEVGRPAKDIGSAGEFKQDSNEVEKSMRASTQQSSGSQGGVPRK